jgi:hypothetical protein
LSFQHFNFSKQPDAPPRVQLTKNETEVLIQLATNCAEKVVIQWNEKVEAGEQRDSIPGQFLKLLINAPAAKEALLKSLTKNFTHITITLTINTLGI